MHEIRLDEWEGRTKPASAKSPASPHESTCFLAVLVSFGRRTCKRLANRFCWRVWAVHTKGRADSTEPVAIGAETTRRAGEYWCSCDY